MTLIDQLANTHALVERELSVHVRFRLFAGRPGDAQPAANPGYAGHGR
jgi:hypothetical protein